MVVLSCGILIEESKLFSLYQDRVTCVTFTTEHSNTHLELGDLSDDDGEKLVMTGMEREAGKWESVISLVNFKIRFIRNERQGKWSKMNQVSLEF